MGNNLKSIRNLKGLTQQEAADGMRVSKGQYIKLERGDRRLNEDYIMRAARTFRVPPSEIIAEDDDLLPADPAASLQGYLEFAGVAEAGAFREVDVHNDDRRRVVPIAPDPRYKRARQYVWQIAGDSMNRAGLLDGMFAVGIDYKDFVEFYRDIEPGDIVVVERMRFDGQERELTCKKFWKERGGIAFVPDSTNDKHRAISVPRDGEIEGESITILAYVTGAYTLFGKAVYDLDEGQLVKLK